MSLAMVTTAKAIKVLLRRIFQVAMMMILLQDNYEKLQKKNKTPSYVKSYGKNIGNIKNNKQALMRPHLTLLVNK